MWSLEMVAGEKIQLKLKKVQNNVSPRGIAIYGL